MNRWYDFADASLLSAGLLGFALRGAVVLALAALVTLGMKRRSAAARHGVWLLAIGSVLLLPILSWTLPAWQVLPPWMGGTAAAAFAGAPASPPALPTLSSMSIPANADFPGAPTPPSASKMGQADLTLSSAGATAVGVAASANPQRPAVFNLWAWLPALWLAGVALSLLPLAIGGVSLARLKFRSRRVESLAWLERVRRPAEALRLRRPVTILLSAERQMPMTWGIIRAIVLLPESAEHWSEARCRQVLLHELAHVRRRDCLWQLVTQLACALHWFNPLAWLAARRLAAEREQACDDLVLQCGASPTGYAEELLAIAAEGSGLGLVRWGAIAMARRSSLEVRLRAILDARRDRGIPGAKATLAYGALAAAVVVTVAMLRAGTPVPVAAPPASAPPPTSFVYQISTLAGGKERANGQTIDGPVAVATFDTTVGVAVDQAGNVYAVDGNDQTIRKITPAGVVTTVAGVSKSSGEVNGPAEASAARGIVGEAENLGTDVVMAVETARFSDPWGVAVDRAGNLYVADRWNHGIRKITVDGEVTSLAGSRAHQGSADGPGSAAGFSEPMGVAVDWARNVYVADTANDTIRKITPDGVVSTLAGLAGESGSQDGRGTAARFYGPRGVAVDEAGNVYVADTQNQTIREIAPDGAVTTLAGTPGGKGFADGKGDAARFSVPQRVAVDHAGNVFVADLDTIRKLTPDGTVTTVAGLARSPAGTVDGTGSVVRLSPYDVAVDELGNLYIAVGDYSIRKGTLTRVPAAPTAPVKVSAAAATSPSVFPHTDLDTVLSYLQATDRDLRMWADMNGENVGKALEHLALGLTATEAAIGYLRANPSRAAETVGITPAFTAALSRLEAAQPAVKRGGGSRNPMAAELQELRFALVAMRAAPGGDLGGARDKIIASIAQTADDVIANLNSIRKD